MVLCRRAEVIFWFPCLDEPFGHSVPIPVDNVTVSVAIFLGGKKSARWVELWYEYLTLAMGKSSLEVGRDLESRGGRTL